jgi:hypothetical protein
MPELRREPVAAFCPTPLENEASGLARHAGTKTVCPCALQVARLIRTFHLSGTCFFACLSKACVPEGRQEYAQGQTVSIEPSGSAPGDSIDCPVCLNTRTNSALSGNSLASRYDALESLHP